MESSLHHGIDAIFFDLDGVLVDAPSWHEDALNKALDVYGFDAISHDVHMSKYNGLSTKKKLKMLCSNGILPNKSELFEAIHLRKQEETLDLINKNCKPIERVIKTVQLAKSEASSIAVVTNCSRPSCELMLQLSGIYDLFDLIVTNEDVNGKIKPHPMPYLKARYDLNISNGKALAIDDTTKGIMSALEAGCRTWRLKKFDDLSVENLTAMLNSLKVRI